MTLGNYPRLTQKQVKAILAEPASQSAQWRIRTERNGKGDYGRDETYYRNDEAVFLLVVSYIDAKTIAYDLRGAA
jgi:hypothetical protein